MWKSTEAERRLQRIENHITHFGAQTLQPYYRRSEGDSKLYGC